MRFLQVVLWALAVPLLIAGVVVPLQLGPYRAQQRLLSEEWHMKNRDNPKELRDTAVEALDLWWSDPHDAFGILGQYGDASSIPALRRALARRPADDGECTWDHGLRALAKLEHRKYP